jgi:two-component system response regulator PilR (NtrC family)
MMDILIVDDEVALARLLQTTLKAEGYGADVVFSGEEAVRAVRSRRYDVVLTDLAMKPVDGLEVLRVAKEEWADTEVIMMTAYASAESAVQAMKNGAHDYLIKPFDTDELLLHLRNIGERRRLRDENVALRGMVERMVSFESLVGPCDKMQQVFRLVEKVASSKATVLIRGESGTGKELLAQAIHFRSPRRGGPLIKVNCAAIPENLLESELFGHEKGAFTGAHQQRKGRFELADRGSIFLDEIGDLTPNLQVKLLRILQEGEFQRVGGTNTLRSDTRVIAATHCDLEEAMAGGRFREDLYYRLNVFPIHIPPLRERKEDIPYLVKHFIEKHGSPGDGIEPDALDTLTRYHWPGNVRELENVVERSLIMKNGSHVTEDDLPGHVTRSQGLRAATGGIEIPDEGIKIDDMERAVIQKALEKAGGNKTRAAQLIGITRRKLYSRMEILGIPVKDNG